MAGGSAARRLTGTASQGLPTGRSLTPGGSRRRNVLSAVTPLASIFGSGFLIIVPILERTLGALAAAGMAGVCLLAWLVGGVIRHNVAAAARRAGHLGAATMHIERASDLVIVVAYVISVALYLRILAQFVVDYVSSGSTVAERLLAVAVLAIITAVGLIRGLHGLDLLERVSLAAVLVLVTLIVIAFAGEDVTRTAHGALHLPAIPVKDPISALLTLGGIVITVQGFETVRYLHDVDAATRIAASRIAQITSSVVYVLLVALATPLMGLGTVAGPDQNLLVLVGRVTPILALPLVLCAALSQFSAATADTEASVGNLRGIAWRPLRGRRSYLLVGGVATVLAATLQTPIIIVVASRAFAAYYALQCLVAMRTSDRAVTRIAYAALALVMLTITILARPAA